ncbi:MAG: hypothetical protein A2Y62_14445 [Candidatus Fischerbacteria bacterium RBG_13_37_8]|uniref:Radical SAM core domain-containing protein n=1 Tax=Candidatus Fischerbacteria bacterium RBG_13_37_8 TaxID=1817863 RepID=A0A1F5VNM5_9BACT|nr:MAG: hypothetical protein A2Y62_14445 [Candidatus Fischerbacteria bacterium RBG_13_37_8]
MITAYAKNYLAKKIHGPAYVTHPMLASLYLTHRCNLACVYCSDGNGTPFREKQVAELSTAEMCRVLDRIVKSVKVLDITGGEPLLRDDISKILAYARKIGFRKIILNTNGTMPDRVTDVLKWVDTISISLDSLSPERLMHLYGASEDTAWDILTTIENLSTSEYRTRVLLSMVMMPDNIEDTYDILDYCERKRISFTCSPALKGIYADESLAHSEAYRNAIDAIIARKKKGLHAVGSIAYYKLIRNFERYQCYPMLMPVINPGGRLYVPCLEIEQKMTSLMEYRSLHDAIKHSLTEITYPPACGNVCHILCHAGLSILYKNIFTALKEIGI